MFSAHHPLASDCWPEQRQAAYLSRAAAAAVRVGGVRLFHSAIVVQQDGSHISNPTYEDLSSMKNMTKKELEVLGFLRSYFLENDQIPSCMAICHHFGYASENSAHCFLVSLERKGQIERNSCGKYRFTRIKDGSQPVGATA